MQQYLPLSKYCYKPSFNEEENYRLEVHITAQTVTVSMQRSAAAAGNGAMHF